MRSARRRPLPNPRSASGSNAGISRRRSEYSDARSIYSALLERALDELGGGGDLVNQAIEIRVERERVAPIVDRYPCATIWRKQRSSRAGARLAADARALTYRAQQYLIGQWARPGGDLPCAHSGDSRTGSLPASVGVTRRTVLTGSCSTHPARQLRRQETVQEIRQTIASDAPSAKRLPRANPSDNVASRQRHPRR